MTSKCNVLGWILEQKKDINGKTGEIQKVWSLVNSDINVSFLGLTNVPGNVRC